jgi:hypothetical protein
METIIDVLEVRDLRAGSTRLAMVEEREAIDLDIHEGVCKSV